MKAHDPMGLRAPPHSFEAEQSILGGLLLDNAAWDRAGDVLLESDFYRYEHRLIFGVIAGLVTASKPADVVTVHEQLQRLRKADDCGRLLYLNTLSQSVPSASNIRSYTAIVRERAQQRALIAALNDAQEIAWCDDGSAAEKLSRIGNALGALERRGMSKEPRPIDVLTDERLEHYNRLAEGESVAAIPTGIVSLDRALGGGLKTGKLVVLGARPTVGKTSFAGQVSAAGAAAGHVVLILSQEMTAGELVDRFVANAAGVQLASLTSGELTATDWHDLVNGTERLRGLRLFVDDSAALTLHQISAKARQVHRQHGLAMVVVDYLQLCASPLASDKRHHQIEAISRGLKQLAKELDTCVLLLSQLSRASLDRGEPELSDLKESGAIEEDADAVLLLHPMGNEPDGAMVLLLKLAKNRQGKRGRIALTFDGRTQRWAESNRNVDRRPKGDT